MCEKILHGVRDEEQGRTFVPELAKEEFDVRAWEAVHGHKTQRGIFSDHWAADLPDVHPIGIISYQLGGLQSRSKESTWRGETDNFRCTSAFLDSYLLRRSLDFRY